MRHDSRILHRLATAIVTAIVTAAALMLCVASAEAQGTTPASGADVLRAMHDRYASTWYSTISFTQATTRRTRADSLIHETWYEAAKLPGRLRIDLGVQDGAHVLLFNGDSTFAKFTGYPVHRSPGRNPLLILGFDVYKQPIERTMALLQIEGFDLATVHTDTLDGHPVYVVGAPAGDSTSKQFWVDRDKLIVVRLLTTGQAPAIVSDVRFTDYQAIAGGWIAMHVTVTEGGRLMQEERYSNVRANPPLDDALFDPTALR